MDQGKYILSLMHQLDNSPEFALFIQMEALRSSRRIFGGNYRELTDLLGILENPMVAIPLRDAKRRAISRSALEIVTRLLHNFIASAKTLIDHTRTHMHSLYEGHPFLEEYEARVEARFASSPVQRFVQDLRNYTQHYKLPLTGSSFSWDSAQGLNITYFADTEELAKWDKWSPEGRQYLDAFQKILPLRQLASDYLSLVDEFYKWIDKREREVNSEKLERLRQMQKRIASLTKKNER